jgi:tetratricopeptide (TPR) repeat protein
MVLMKIPIHADVLVRAAFIAATLTLIAFLHGCGTSRTAEVDKQYQRIVEQQTAKRDAIAGALMEPKLRPSNDPAAHERRGDTYLQSGNTAMACLEYGKAIQADPDRLDTRQKLAHLLLKQEIWAKALDEFDIILEKSPQNQRAMQGKATALIHLDRLKEAREILVSLIGTNSRAWQAHALLGTIFDRQKMYQFSIDEYQRTLAINPKSSGVYERLGKALYMTGQYRESATAFLKAIDKDGPDPRRYNELGLALFKLGLAAEAYETFKKAGDEATACNTMGILYLDMKEYDRSIGYFEKAIDLKPEFFASAHKNLKTARSAMQALKEK